MATFTIDLITGKVYLFSGDFTSGGTGPVSGATYPEVNQYGELPTPASAYSGKIYLVRNSSGSYVLNRKESGLYFSTGTLWKRLGDIPSFFNSHNFQIYDGDDNSKGVEFDTSDITTNTFRQIKIQDADGTIAYLTDIGDKLDTSIFANYTGNTVPNTYLEISEFDDYSGQTFSLIQSKQDLLIPGKGILIDGNVISVNIPTALQLKDVTGGVNINTITPNAIEWDVEIFSGTSLNFTGGSRIYINETGMYGISYVLNVINSTNDGKNIGTVIRKNGNQHVTPMSSASFSLNLSNDSSTNIMPEYLVNLENGDYVELIAFRVGYSGMVFTEEDSSWLKMKKII